jgi:hypothetical protein
MSTQCTRLTRACHRRGEACYALVTVAHSLAAYLVVGCELSAVNAFTDHGTRVTEIENASWSVA